MAISLGAIVLTLSADTASLEKGLDKAAHITITKVGDMGKAFKFLGGAIAAAAIPAALFRITEKAIDLADTMNKAAQSAGASVEWLSSMKFAAELADVSFEEFTKGVQKLSRSLLNAGEEKGASNALKQLGIAAKDSEGRLRNVEEVLPAIAERFKELPDGATKTALAMELFGKAGARLIPLLNQGKEGLAAAREEAERYGLVMSTQTARAAEVFNDNLKRLTTGSAALGLTLANEMLPALVGITNALVANKGSMDSVRESAVFLKAVFVGLAELAIRVVDGFTQIGIVARNFAEAPFKGFRAAGEQANRELLEVGKNTNLTIMALKGLGDLGVTVKLPKVGLVVPAAAGAKNAIDGMLESLFKQLETFGMTSRSVKEYELAMAGAGAEARATAKGILDQIDVLEWQKEAIEAATKADEEAIAEEEQFNLRRAAAVEARKQQMLELAKGQFLEGLRFQDQEMVNAIKSVREEWKQFHSDVKRLGSDLSNVAIDAIFNWRGFGELMKSIEKDLLRMVLNKAFTALLGSIFFPGQGGFLGAIGSLLGLGGNVSENRPGRAMGGPVIAGLAYTIGERGRERFVPNVSGSIVPNGAGLATVVNHYYSIDARGAPGGTEAALARLTHDTAVQTAVQTMAERARRRA